MRIKANVIAVENNGGLIAVRAQGSELRGARWRNMGVFSLQIADTPRNQKTFHLGRDIELTVKPK